MTIVFAVLNFLLRLYSTIMSEIRFFCPRRGREGNTPFIVIPIEELSSNLSSPLKVIPCRIERSFKKDATPGMHIFLGTSGIGKTREAADYAINLSNVSGAKVIYLAKGHVNSAVPLPDKREVRKVIVMIDDYDWGFSPAASSSFIKREAAYKEALVNLRNLYDSLKSKLELHALIVTINQHRLPVNSLDINNILPECELLELPSVNIEEFKNFILSTALALNVQVSSRIIESLAKRCDGRFSTIATFLSSFVEGVVVTESDVQRFSDNLTTIWLIFKENMSDEQKHAYENIKILKDYRLSRMY